MPSPFFLVDLTFGTNAVCLAGFFLPAGFFFAAMIAFLVSWLAPIIRLFAAPGEYAVDHVDRQQPDDFHVSALLNFDQYCSALDGRHSDNPQVVNLAVVVPDFRVRQAIKQALGQIVQVAAAIVRRVT